MGKERSDFYGRSKENLFPPHSLIGTYPDISQLDMSNKTGMFRRRHGSSADGAIAEKLHVSARGSK